MPDFNENHPAFAAMLSSLGEFNPLGAVRQPADVYAPCWCGSNKKWKFCHKVRESLPALTFGQLRNAKEKYYRTGSCQHPEASSETCSSPEAIQSHTVQRRGGLGAIAEDGHVYSIKKGFDSIEKNAGVVDMAKLGVGKASVFPGYCNRHDTALFKPVESVGAVLNDMNGFLLSFRALGYELAAKKAQLQSIVESRDIVDRGQPFELQVMFQSFLHLNQIALQKGLADVMEYKSVFDAAYLSQDLRAFSVYGVTFDGTLPFAVAGSFMPEFDFAGTLLQSLAEDKTANQVSLNVTELDGKTSAVFGWFGGPNCPAGNLVASFKTIPDEDKANALLLASVEHLENIYFKPSWWEEISEELKARLHQGINGGMPGTVRSPKALFESGLNALTYNIHSTHEKYSA